MSNAGSGHDQFLENLPGISQHIDQFIIPVLGIRIHKLSCGCLCILAGLLPCEEIMEVIRHVEKRLSLFQILRMFFLNCHQLINCIEDCFLDTGSFIQIFKRDDLVNFLIHPFCTVITIAHRISKNLIVLIHKYEIHTPGINAHAYRDLTDFFTFLHTGNDLFKQTVEFPAKLAVFLYHAVFEAIHFLQLHFAVLHMSQDQTSAGCPDIYRKIICSHYETLLNV